MHSERHRFAEDLLCAGPKVHNTLRASAGADVDGMLVHVYRDSSICPALNQRRRLETVLDVIFTVFGLQVLILHEDWSFRTNGKRSSHSGLWALYLALLLVLPDSSLFI